MLLTEVGVAILVISWLPLKRLTRLLGTRPNAPTGYDKGSLVGYRFGIRLGLALILAGVATGLFSTFR